MGLPNCWRVLRVVDGELQRPFCNAETERRDHRALKIEPAHHDRHAAVFVANEILCRHAAVFEHQLGGLAAAKAHLGQLLRDLEAGKILLDDEGGNAVRRLSLVGLGIDQQHVGDRSIGDVDLAAVEHVVIAIAPRSGAHRSQRVGAGAGLGEAQRADFPARAAGPADICGAAASLPLR